jgi:putative ABC transport system permease protein
MLILAGTVFTVPVVVGPVARLAGRATSRAASGVGDVAVLNLVKERSRSGATLALVMAVLAMTFAGAITHSSWRETLDQTIDYRFPADFAVGAPNLDPELEQQVASIPGVAATTPVRFGTADVVGKGATSLALTVVDPATFFDVQGFPWVDGSDADARTALARGGGVLVPEGLARRFGAERGDTITVTTGQGPRRFTVAGVYATVESLKRIVMGLPDAERWFGTGPPSVLAVRAEPGADLVEVGRSLRNGLRDSNVFVQETTDAKAEVKHGMDQFFNLIYALLLVMVVVGLLGLANTLVMSVTRRTREIGVLRAVGTKRGQVAAMVLVESVTLCLVASALALPVGLGLATSILRSAPSALDVVVDLTVPWKALVLVGALAFDIALIAAIAPARRAARLDPVQALRFD